MNKALFKKTANTAEEVSLLWETTALTIQSESEILLIIDKYFPSSTGHAPLGRGHDCALLNTTHKTALSTDCFVQNIHFRTTYYTPWEVGAKALTSAVSDLAAAGAQPLGFSLALTLPPHISKLALEHIFAGMSIIADTHALTLAGGDITKGKELSFAITVWGECAVTDTAKNMEDCFFHRHTARPNDAVFYIGTLGLAKAGFLLLEKEGRLAIAQWASPCLAFLTPQALISQGIILATLAHSLPNHYMSLMDVSDGLMQDIPRLLNTSTTKYGVSIEATSDFFSPELINVAKHLHTTPAELFYSGGEDYALLGTCAPEVWDTLKKKLPSAVYLGNVISTPEILHNGVAVHAHSFDHFT